MKIAVISDSHDNLGNLQKAIALIQEQGITQGIHLGDICSPFMIENLMESGIRWCCIWGNNDGEKLLGYIRSQGNGLVDLDTSDFRELEIEGRKLFLTHYPQIARMAALSGTYNAALYGHSHKTACEVILNDNGPVATCLYANPGELCGVRFGKPSFGIYDTVLETFNTVML